MHLTDSRERTKIAHKHEEEMKQIVGKLALETTKEEDRHKEEMAKINIKMEETKGKIGIQIKELELKSKKSEL